MDRKNIFILSIFTLITALGWIAFDVYHALTDSTIPQNIEEQIAPVTPTFDKGVIDNIKTRSHVEVLQSNTLLTPSPESAQKIASGTSETKTATKSGSL